MSSIDAELGRTTGTATSTDRRGVARRLSTETKATYKTTEFLTHVVVFAGILLASFLVKTGQDGQRVDYFRADKAWWLHPRSGKAARNAGWQPGGSSIAPGCHHMEGSCDD